MLTSLAASGPASAQHVAALSAPPSAAEESGDGRVVRISRPVISAAGTVETAEGPLSLAGIAVTEPEAQCGEGMAAWPCGRMARLALQRFVRLRSLDCVLPGSGGSGVARCAAGGDDLAEWLVARGWAKADGPEFAEAEKEARDGQLGIWSDVRPGLAAPASFAATPSDAVPADAAVRVFVSLSSQTLTLVHNGETIGSWPVSTARSGKTTPIGVWTAKWLARDHRSSLYDGAPMPYSVFFNGDYAIHGTYDTGRLGSPASAGCVRLSPEHAARLFRLVEREGLASTVVAISP